MRRWRIFLQRRGVDAPSRLRRLILPRRAFSFGAFFCCEVASTMAPPLPSTAVIETAPPAVTQRQPTRLLLL